MNLSAKSKEAELILQQMERLEKESQEHLEEQNREADIRIQELREQSAERIREQKELMNTQLQQQMQIMQEKMTNVTQQLLKSRSAELEENNSKAMEGVVNPLKEKLAELHLLVQTTRDKAQENTASVKEQIRNMLERAQEIGNEATRLTNALTHNTQFQGSMGEQVLGVILDNAGLRKGRDYEEQVTMKSDTGETIINEETGQRMRPDVILHFPDQKDAIIDSKVSLTAYVDYVNAENEADRQVFLKAHLDSIKKHVKELAAKDYAAYIQSPKVAAGYVIMFVPNMGALWTALNAEPDLWRKAADANVYIADEQTLYGALKIVSMTWTQVAQAQNHEKVYELANEMIDRVGLFMEKYEAVGKALKKASEEYEDGKKKLVPQGQSIINTSGKLIKLGAKNSDRHPIKALLDVDEIPALPEGVVSTEVPEGNAE